MKDKVPEVNALFSQEQWEQDKLLRFDLEKFTGSFHESVPSLKYLDWSIKDISRGTATTILPLNVPSTNQHITHQAALMVLAADYTGGIALCTLFHMIPVMGIHPMVTDFGAYLWGAKASIKWIYPSCDDLVCHAKIPEDKWERIAKRFFDGRKVVETVVVNMFNKDKLVGTVDLTYWAQNSYSLRSNALEPKKVNTLFDHSYKSSAKLIAGLRAIEQEKPLKERLFDDPYAFMAADKHGVILAKRFCEYMPQLQDMVSSRTKNLDDFLTQIEGSWNIINLGVGLDTRPWRLDLGDHHIYELDLPLMLGEREDKLLDLESANGTIKRLPIDLREQEIDEVLLSQQNFDQTRPIFFVWEGGSMYFNQEDTNRILNGISRLLVHEKSKLWFDFVSQEVVDNQTGDLGIESFINGMRRMGEPFIKGYKEIDIELLRYSLVIENLNYSNKYINSEDPLYKHYGFCLAKRPI